MVRDITTSFVICQINSTRNIVWNGTRKYF
jgi:hypothetical protein